MKYLKVFENSVDYEATEEIQVSYIEDTGEVKYHKKVVTKITDIKVGDNLRGKKIYNTRLDLPRGSGDNYARGSLKTTNASVSGKGIEVGSLSYQGGQTGVQLYKGSGPGPDTIFYDGGGNWKDVIFTAPDDTDYIVSSNTLASSTEGYWGWEYVVVE